MAPPVPDAGEVLVRLHRRGGDVTMAHLRAASQLREAWRAGGESAVQNALRAVGRGGTPLLLWTVVHGRTLAAWCALPINQQHGPPDPKKALGRLLVALDVLAEHFGIASAPG